METLHEKLDQGDDRTKLQLEKTKEAVNGIAAVVLAASQAEFEVHLWPGEGRP